MEVSNLERWKRRWREGMFRTPFVSCPICRKLTCAEWKCQHCKTEWNEEQLRERDKIRANMILKTSEDERMDEDIRSYLRVYALSIFQRLGSKIHA